MKDPGGRPVAVLFDLDGTLVTTGGAGARAWSRAFERLHRVPADIEKVTEAGWTDPRVVRETFEKVIGRTASPPELGRIISLYLEFLPEEVEASPGYRVLDGVPELLSRLSDRGLLLGMTTGNLEPAAQIKLARGRLDRFFCFGGYGSDSEDRGELTRMAIERAGTIAGGRIDPALVLVVGDTPRDVEAARAAGAVAVAVASGNYPAAELEMTGADHVLGSLAEPFPVDAD